MIYIVGTGVNHMKDNFVYCVPTTVEEFKAKEYGLVINTCSGNAYSVETAVVMPEQMFETLGEALNFAGVQFSDINLSPKIKNFIDGVISEDVLRLALELSEALGKINAYGIGLLSTLNKTGIDPDQLILGQKFVSLAKELN